MTTVKQLDEHLPPVLSSIIMEYATIDWKEKFALVTPNLKMWECKKCDGPMDEDRDGCWEDDDDRQFICIHCYDVERDEDTTFIAKPYFMWRHNKLNELRHARRMANYAKQEEHKKAVAMMLEMDEKVKQWHIAARREARYSELNCSYEAICNAYNEESDPRKKKYLLQLHDEVTAKLKSGDY